MSAAKSLQSCPTLCDLIDGSPPGSSVHRIFQARVLEWGAIAFSDGDCSHEIKRRLLLGGKAMTNLHSILKSRAITLLIKVPLGKAISLFTFMHWRRKWQPTPVFLPGESQGQRSLVGGRLWGRTESDTAEAT